MWSAVSHCAQTAWCSLASQAWKRGCTFVVLSAAPSHPARTWLLCLPHTQDRVPGRSVSTCSRVPSEADLPRGSRAPQVPGKSQKQIATTAPALPLERRAPKFGLRESDPPDPPKRPPEQYRGPLQTLRQDTWPWVGALPSLASTPTLDLPIRVLRLVGRRRTDWIGWQTPCGVISQNERHCQSEFRACPDRGICRSAGKAVSPVFIRPFACFADRP